MNIQKQLVVRIKDSETTPFSDSIQFTEEIGDGYPDLKSVFQKYPNVSLRPLTADRKNGRIDQLVEEAMKNDPDYRREVEVSRRTDAHLRLDKFDYFLVDAGDVEIDELLRDFQNASPVQVAYVEYPVTERAHHAASVTPDVTEQGYLGASPIGIDAIFAHGRPGGDGEGVAFIDIERGWQFDHPDLVLHGLTAPIAGDVRDSDRAHGTRVLGTLCAKRNAFGMVGIVPNSGPNAVSQFDIQLGTDNYTEAIIEAIERLKSFPGSVLLIEAQVGVPSGQLAPIEVNYKEYAAIRLATALDIVVVECGGNSPNVSGLAMDQFDGGDGRVFDSGSQNFRDSRAIIVSAATHSNQVWGKRARAPHGKRIDCFAWGENIATTDLNGYTPNFNGTSGAGAIVAGAAIAVQAIGKKRFDDGGFFTPQQLRSILRNPATGTLSDGSFDIGVMPDLKRIIESMDSFGSRKSYLAQFP